jgi:hypothetical protein
MASSDPNLSLEEMVKHIYVTVNRMESRFSEQQQRITECEAKVDVLNRQVYDLQNIVNLREQELRGLSVRVSGLPYLDDEKASTDSEFLAKRVYDRIFLPMLNYAKSRNGVDKIPNLNNTIASCYRVGSAAAKTNTPTPPPIVIKFVSEHTMLAILKNKRQHTPSPTNEEMAAGYKRFIIAEDLTPQCFKLLRELQRNEDIAKAWTSDGKIRFVLKDSTTIHKVKSVFDPVQLILSKIKS